MQVKRISVFLVAVTVFFLFPFFVEARSTRSSPSDVHVNGYFRKNGTYVQPYYRSAPDGIISNNYSCIDDGRCGGSTSVYVPPVVPVIIPENPVTAGSVTFEKTNTKPYYKVKVNWTDSVYRNYSISLTKIAGSDPGPKVDVSVGAFVFDKVKPGKWYVNLKSQVGNQWSKVVYWTVDVPDWVPTPTSTPFPTVIPTQNDNVKGTTTERTSADIINTYKTEKMKELYDSGNIFQKFGIIIYSLLNSE